MAENLLNYFNYAEINSNNRCIGVHSYEEEPISIPEGWVPIPVYDGEYLGKYYINGQWYEDAAGTIPWQSSLI